MQGFPQRSKVSSKERLSAFHSRQRRVTALEDRTILLLLRTQTFAAWWRESRSPDLKDFILICLGFSTGPLKQIFLWERGQRFCCNKRCKTELLSPWKPRLSSLLALGKYKRKQSCLGVGRRELWSEDFPTKDLSPCSVDGYSGTLSGNVCESKTLLITTAVSFFLSPTSKWGALCPNFTLWKLRGLDCS